MFELEVQIWSKYSPVPWAPYSDFYLATGNLFTTIPYILNCVNKLTHQSAVFTLGFFARCTQQSLTENLLCHSHVNCWQEEESMPPALKPCSSHHLCLPCLWFCVTHLAPGHSLPYLVLRVFMLQFLSSPISLEAEATCSVFCNLQSNDLWFI